MPGLTKRLSCCFEEDLVLDFLARTQSCEPIQPDIDPNDCLRVLGKGIGQFDPYRDKPPVGGFGHAGPCHLAIEAQLLSHIHPSQLGYPDAMITQFELIVGEIEARLAALFALEPGVLGFAFEKGGEGFTKIQKRLV